ncbi:MAG TPA: type II toxin-antitoxin system VapC family toxin [Bacteroidia bacterium]|nr:type II toxin-antitoxin system VapC family toxin [Bacteroidia bacterium]
MADKIVLADTSVMIDYFRKTDKNKAQLITLALQGYSFCISAITEYEIYSGATPAQLPFWNELLEKVQVIPFDKAAVKTAVEINRRLKHKRKQIDLADLFIAAIAVAHKLPFATLNKKHFDRIEELEIVK